MSRKDKAPASIVAEVERRTAEAAALAAIAGQERLTDPRTNPAVRAVADELRDEQQRRALAAEHARLLRRHRVADRRAADAERTLEAIALARQASNPARSVLALHTSRRRYMRVSLVASVVLAAGSAMGVEAAAQHLHAPTGSGYIAEIGLTGLATLAITYRAHLAEHRGTVLAKSWQSRVLWALMTVPLLVSVACNAATLNVLGAFCALGAAAFSVLSCVIADRSAAAMQERAAEVSDQDESELRSVAMGDDLFTAPEPPAVPERDEPQDGGQDEGQDDAAATEDEGQEDGAEPSAPVVRDLVAAEADRGAAELEAWLADQDGPPDEGAASSVPSPGGEGPQGAAAEARQDDQDEATIRPGGHIDADQRDQDDRDGGAEDGPDRPEPGRVLPAIEARRAVGASTRQRIAEYLAEHPTATVPEIAEALDLSRTTVKRHRRELRALRQSGGTQ